MRTKEEAHAPTQAVTPLQRLHDAMVAKGFTRADDRQPFEGRNAGVCEVNGVQWSMLFNKRANAFLLIPHNAQVTTAREIQPPTGPHRLASCDVADFSKHELLRWHPSRDTQPSLLYRPLPARERLPSVDEWKAARVAEGATVRDLPVNRSVHGHFHAQEIHLREGRFAVLEECSDCLMLVPVSQETKKALGQKVEIHYNSFQNRVSVSNERDLGWER